MILCMKNSDRHCNVSKVMKEKSLVRYDDHRRRELLRPSSSCELRYKGLILLSNSIFFHEFTFNSLSLSRIHFQSTIFFANLLRVHYLFRESKSNLLSFSRIHSQFTILFRGITFNSRSFSRIYFEFTISFSN